MPRRGNVKERIIPPDAKYNNETVARLINRVMKNGQKRTAEKIVYTTLELIEEQTKGDALDVLDQAIKNLTPALGVRPRRVAGATYQVPVEVRAARGRFLSMRWLIDSARARKGKSMAEKLAAELMEAAQGQGAAAKKREDMHRMAQSNRAFAHFRW